MQKRFLPRLPAPRWRRLRRPYRATSRPGLAAIVASLLVLGSLGTAGPGLGAEKNAASTLNLATLASQPIIGSVLNAPAPSDAASVTYSGASCVNGNPVPVTTSAGTTQSALCVVAGTYEDTSWYDSNEPFSEVYDPSTSSWYLVDVPTAPGKDTAKITTLVCLGGNPACQLSGLYELSNYEWMPFDESLGSTGNGNATWTENSWFASTAYGSNVASGSASVSGDPMACESSTCLQAFDIQTGSSVMALFGSSTTEGASWTMDSVESPGSGSYDVTSITPAGQNASGAIS
jgi:hypothetical protein